MAYPVSLNPYFRFTGFSASAPVPVFNGPDGVRWMAGYNRWDGDPINAYYSNDRGLTWALHSQGASTFIVTNIRTLAHPTDPNKFVLVYMERAVAGWTVIKLRDFDMGTQSWGAVYGGDFPVEQRTFSYFAARPTVGDIVCLAQPTSGPWSWTTITSGGAWSTPITALADAGFGSAKPAYIGLAATPGGYAHGIAGIYQSGGNADIYRVTLAPDNTPTTQLIGAEDDGWVIGNMEIAAAGAEVFIAGTKTDMPSGANPRVYVEHFAEDAAFPGWAFWNAATDTTDGYLLTAPTDGLVYVFYSDTDPKYTSFSGASWVASNGLTASLFAGASGWATGWPSSMGSLDANTMYGLYGTDYYEFSQSRSRGLWYGY